MQNVVKNARVLPEAGAALETEARQMADNPCDYFEGSLTRMHSLPWETLQALQLQALKWRFSQLRDCIPMLKKLADQQEIHRIDTLDDIVPLLFEDSMFKSYPPTLLENKRFDLLTNFLQKLTSLDLNQADLSGCGGIDDWIQRLDAQTDLRVCHTSGTSGTFSLIPWSAAEWDRVGRMYGATYLQKFGEVADCRTAPGIHYIYPGYRTGASGILRTMDVTVKYVTKGEERFHCLYKDRQSADMMYLAGRLRAAKALGRTPTVDSELLKRKDEFDRKMAEMPRSMDAFFQSMVKEFQGQTVMLGGTWNIVYNLADACLKQGMRGIFAPDSKITWGGGAKGMTPPPDLNEKIMEFAGTDHVYKAFGMTEVAVATLTCKEDRYHMLPTLIVCILDPDTSKPLPRKGVVTGRAAYFDLTADTRWGGFISGDEVTVHWDADCPCGAKTPYYEDNIGRYSEKRGGSDKITCAATESAHREAMEFLSQLEVPNG